MLLLAACAIALLACEGENAEKAPTAATESTTEAAPNDPSESTGDGDGPPGAAQATQGAKAADAPMRAPVTPDPATGATRAADVQPATEPEPDADDDDLTLRKYMLEVVAPRLGDPEAAATLEDALTGIPAVVDDPWRERFQETLAERDPEAPVAATCKRCHVMHRSRFRAELGVLPLQTRDDVSPGSVPSAEPKHAP